MGIGGIALGCKVSGVKLVDELRYDQNDFMKVRALPLFSNQCRLLDRDTTIAICVGSWIIQSSGKVVCEDTTDDGQPFFLKTLPALFGCIHRGDG